MIRAALVLACSALVVTGGAAAGAVSSGGNGLQPPPPAATTKCIKCKSLGRLPCSEHGAAECEWELEVLYCSHIAGCGVCGGVGWVDCPECDMPEVPQWIAERKLKISARKTALKYIDDAMQREVRKGETPHAVVVWEMEDMKVEKRRLPPHEMLHLYLRRLETLYTDFCTRMELNDRLFAHKPDVYVWRLPDDHQRAGTALCSQNASGGVKLMGSTPRYTVCGNKQHFQDDEKLHRNIVHSTTHLLLSCLAPPGWVGNLKGGWMDEGLAHFYEDRYWGICDNYCYQEQNTNVDFKSGKYRLAVRKLVTDGTAPSLSELFQQNTDTLTLPMHAVAMSVVDYLLGKDGAKFYELSKKLKAKVPTAEALQQVYGMRPLELEAVWKSYVLATYPTR